MKKTSNKVENDLGNSDIMYLIKEELKTIGGESSNRKYPQVVPTQDIRDLLNDFPNMLKDLGVLKCIQTIITNLYLMNRRPTDPCREIHELLEGVFSSSGKNKAERQILERDYHKQLLKELRIKQEIGKLKSLCHFLLPEEYGPNGEQTKEERAEASKSVPDEIVVELKNEIETLEDNNDSSTTLNSKKAKGKKGRRKSKDHSSASILSKTSPRNKKQKKTTKGKN